MFKVIIVLLPLHFCQFSENFLQRALIKSIDFHHSSQITTLPNSPNYVLFKKIKQQQQRKQLQVLLMPPVYFWVCGLCWRVFNNTRGCILEWN